MTYDFPPERRIGLIFHTLVFLGLAGGTAAAIWMATQQEVGTNFVLFILLALVLFLPLPLIAYRGYALLSALYSVERDGLRLRWGLRAEDIPLPEIEWVRPATDLAFDLPLPRLSWPGAVLGSLNVRDLGPVEYLASNRVLILLVATTTRVYAISPADPVAFVRAFQYATEMGSLTPLHSFSARPAVFLRGVWGDLPARILVSVGLLLTLALFILVSLTISTRTSISLGFTAAGQLVEPGTSAQLLLLPVLCVFAFIADLIGGLYFYRSQRSLAYLFWAGGILTPLMLLAATLFLT
jgi:hypothetical protein